MTATFYVGDVLDVLGKLPENSVDLVLSSPPFLALRSYLPADHPLKEKEGGSQSTPGEYIDWLLDVVEACDRVLAKHGSLAFELGDTYAGSGGAGGDYNENGLREGQNKFVGSARRNGKVERKPHRRYLEGYPDFLDRWPEDKSLCEIPETFRWSMVHGFNPFTGRLTPRWKNRNVVRWVRPNPPVGALGDKFRPATSELMVFCKSAKRYFDLDAVREPPTKKPQRFLSQDPVRSVAGPRDKRQPSELGKFKSDEPTNKVHPAGAPPLDWWRVDGATAASQKLWWCELHDHEMANGTFCYAVLTLRIEGAEPCPAVERLLTTQAPPLDWWNISPSEETSDEEYHAWQRANEAPTVYSSPQNDWWNIPLLEGEEPKKMGPKPRPPRTTTGGKQIGRNVAGNDADPNYRPNYEDRPLNPAGAPPLDWWNIPPGGYSGSHYAVWPEELLIKPIKAMAPQQVCRTCGEARRRIVESYRTLDGIRRDDLGDWSKPESREIKVGQPWKEGIGHQRFATVHDTLGFSDCGHNDYRPGLVLDPFVGSGTTLAVATGHGRDAIGVDLDERNYSLALERVGPLVLQRGEVAA